MLRIFVISLAAFMMAFFADYSAKASSVFQGFQPTVSLSGVTLPLSRAMILNTRTDATNQFVTLRYKGLPYQVPTGKKLVIVALSLISGSAGSITMGYGDNATITTVPANAVDFVAGQYAWTGVSPGSTLVQYLINFEVPAGKYPFVTGGSASSHTVSYLAYLSDT